MGAIVLRQPFGGMGKSCFGPGMKAGGPNYLAQFMQFAPRSSMSTDDMRKSYERLWRDEFSREHDHFKLIGQDNIRRYLPFGVVRVRVAPADTAFEIEARVAAARVTGAQVVVSKSPELKSEGWSEYGRKSGSWARNEEVVDETDEELAARIAVQPAHGTERIRYAGPGRVPERVRLAAAQAGVSLADEPVLAEGRIELLWYVREQSISHDYHRYGNLGARSREARREPA